MRVVALQTLVVGPRENPVSVAPNEETDLSKEEAERCIALGAAKAAEAKAPKAPKEIEK